MTAAQRAVALRRLRALAKRGRLGRLPIPQHPDAQERQYRGAILAYVARFQKLVTSQILPLLEQLPEEPGRGHRADAPSERSARELFAQLSRRIVQQTPNASLAQAARRSAAEVSAYQRGQMRHAFVASLGVDLFDLFAAEPDLRQAVEAFTARNVALIRSVSTRYLTEVEELVIPAARAGTRASTLAKEIAWRGQVAESNAERIARDQIGKFQGQLNQVRQQALGLERYRWRTMRDNHVRREHVLREGQIFEWDNPPSDTPDDGHPGTPIGCRCYPEPMIEDVFSQLAE